MGGELVETRAGFSRDTSIRVYAVGLATCAIWSRLVEMRTIAGPPSVVQWLLSGGP